MTEQRVERRIVTVLFADLVGFTTLSEKLDAEDVATVQDAYFAMVREAVARHGGRLEKFIGDAAMAAFGAERARDDDAVRAVRAGLALIHGIQQIAARLGLDEEVLRLRVGINTGEVVAATGGPDEGRVTGDTVNTAARLQAAAPPSGVLVGEATALAVADSAHLEGVAPLELKGKAQLTAAFLVTGLREEPSREQAMGRLRSPMLGRQPELDALVAAWRRAVAGGVERWLIAAPPGVGKSRLLREFAGAVEADAEGTVTGMVWRTRARPDSVSPFDPIAALLLDALTSNGLPADSPAEGRTEAATEILLECLRRVGAPQLRARVATEAVLSIIAPGTVGSGQVPQQDRDALFDAWLHAFAALAENGPTAWLIEDVHWAGRDVLAFIDLAGRARHDEAGRLVVTTARPSLLEREPEWSAPSEEAGRHVMSLATLAGDDARELVTALVGDALPDALVAAIVERSDGNCLFIEELLRTWVSVGTLVPDGQGWRLTVEAGDVALPTSVQAIYAAQLDDLPPSARAVARRASVVGRRFSAEALAPLGIDRPTTKHALDALAVRDFVSGPASEPLWSNVYAYRHALLRDAGYASLARAERARLHIRLARWMEEAAGARSTEIAEAIAGHYAAALDSAPALAAELDEGLDRSTVQRLAADWYERAGRASLALSAHDAARSLLRRAIELTDEQTPLALARRWQALAEATAYAADMDEGAAAFERSIELYRAALEDGESEVVPARAGLAATIAALCDVWYQQLRFVEARDLADATIRELEAQAPLEPVSLARLLIARAGGALGEQGSSEAIVEEFGRAVALAREVGDGLLEARAFEAWTVARQELGGSDAAEWLAVREMADRAGAWDIALSALLNRAGTLIDDDAEAAIATAAEARELAVAHGRTEDVGWCDYSTAEAAFLLGDWDRAVADAERAIELADTNAYRRLAVRSWHVLVPISAARGDRATLERAAAYYAALSGPFPDSPYARIMRPAQDLEFAAAGLIPSFTLDAEPRIDSYSEEFGSPSWTSAADRVFRALIEGGELDGAGRIVAAMDDARNRSKSGSTLGLGTRDLLRARYQLARGDKTAAVQAGSAALEQFRRSRAPWWIAKAIRLLQRAGSAPVEQVTEAEAIERQLGCVAPTA